MQIQPISLRAGPCPVSFIGCGDISGVNFSNDSRGIHRGDIFVAVRGSQVDGHAFLDRAAAAGASAVVVEEPVVHLSIPQCVVRNTRQTWAWIGMQRLGNPAAHLRVSGVTGTNGKTTVTWLLRSILRQAGLQTGMIGTIEYSDGLQTHPAGMTTPDPFDIAALFRQMVALKTTDCVMEISSHALDQRRCSALQLSAAALTNITQDHFDYHGDFEQYLRSKVRMAELLASGVPLLVGIDDAGVRSALVHLQHVPLRTFGLSADSDLRIQQLQPDETGQRLEVSVEGRSLELRTCLIGRHNALNVLAAAGMAHYLGIPPDVIQRGLEGLEHVPGRMEHIHGSQSFRVVIDYAHTPDGLQHAIETLRVLTSGRVIVVFGAGGDRDRNKRPLMAKAAQSADVAIVTSDNPRSESPREILTEICGGFQAAFDYRQIVDREQAIRAALSSAEPGDCVLIAGRGHESLQVIGTRQISFDDRRVTRRLLRELGYSA